MSIRLIAKDLYRLQQEVAALEQELKNAKSEDREPLKDRLRKAKAERNRMLNILEGAKDPPSYRRPR
jgi:hypothetical protein